MALGLLKISKKTEKTIREMAKEKKCVSSIIINEELIKWNNNQENILEYDTSDKTNNISLYFKTNTKIKNILQRYNQQK